MSLNPAPLNTGISEAPDNGLAYWHVTEDDTRIRIGWWPSETPEAGTIFIFPGRTEYIEKYGRTVTDFRALGFSCLVIDWRGQGLSDRDTNDPMMGHVRRYRDYQKDVSSMVAAAKDLGCPEPWYMVGHSMGACIGLRALQEGFPAKACAFTSPMWDINLPIAKRLAAWPFAALSTYLGRSRRYAPGSDAIGYVSKTPFPENRLTNDPEMYQYYLRQIDALPDYQLGGLSIGWLFETLKETRTLAKMASPRVPCITFLGLQDVVIDIPAAEQRMADWPDAKLVKLGTARHDIFSEIPEIRNDVATQIGRLFGQTRK